MSCERIQSELFYLAEDDIRAKRELDRHLSDCAVCSRDWHRYQAVLEAYTAEQLPQPPPVRDAERPLRVWKLARIAAVLAFVLFLSTLGPEPPGKTPTVPNRPVRSGLLDWEVPRIQYSYYPVEMENRDFQEHVNYLRESIAVLQNASSPERF